MTSNIAPPKGVMSDRTPETFSGALQPNVPILNQKYFSDCIHPNDNGHKIIANKIIQAVSVCLDSLDKIR